MEALQAVRLPKEISIEDAVSGGGNVQKGQGPIAQGLL